VQVGSLPSQAEAERQWSSLSARLAGVIGDLPHRFVQVDLPGKGTYTRILIGAFADRAGATELCGRLKRAGRDCLVQKL
jgi:hypothetical protein